MQPHQSSVDLVIYGAWYLSRVIAEAAQICGYRVLGFVDPDPPPDVETLKQTSGPAEGLSCFVAIGDNTQRQWVSQRLLDAGRQLPTLIHPTAWVSPNARLGDGVYVGEHAVVRTACRIGRGVVVNAGAIASHDCVISDFVGLGPGALIASRVHVGDRSQLGVGACVRPCISIGEDCVVGAGAVVVKDLPDDTTAVGNPARILNSSNKKKVLSDWSHHDIW